MAFYMREKGKRKKRERERGRKRESERERLTRICVLHFLAP